MAAVLEPSNWESKKTTGIPMPRALMSKVFTIQEQMANGSAKMKLVRKNQKDILKVKNAVKETGKKKCL